MDNSSFQKDRRRYPRLLLDLPLEYKVVDAPYTHGGLVVNASEIGLLINSVKNMPIGTKLNIMVLFPKGFELSNFKVEAEIIWKDIHIEEGWEGYQYGLKIINILEEDRKKLKQLLNGEFRIEEVI